MGKTMNNIVASIVTSTNTPEKTVRAVIKALVGLTQEELKTVEGYVTIPGLGTFRSVKKGDRNARNPRTGEKKWVPGYLKPVFKGSTALKESINGRGTKAAAPAAQPAPVAQPAPAASKAPAVKKSA
jgi:nucleoid DNA-binding protein